MTGKSWYPQEEPQTPIDSTLLVSSFARRCMPIPISKHWDSEHFPWNLSRLIHCNTEKPKGILLHPSNVCAYSLCKPVVFIASLCRHMDSDDNTRNQVTEHSFSVLGVDDTLLTPLNHIGHGSTHPWFIPSPLINVLWWMLLQYVMAMPQTYQNK